MKQFFDIDANEFGYADCDMMTRFDGSLMMKISDFTALDINTGEIHMISGLDGFDEDNSCSHYDWMDDDEE